MNQEKSESPFAALSWEEQQHRWMEWRSRQLDYRPTEEAPPVPKAPEKGLRAPNLPMSAPPRHRELDQVLSRHRTALRRAGEFHPTETP